MIVRRVRSSYAIVSRFLQTRRKLHPPLTFLAYVAVVSTVTAFYPDWVFNYDVPTDGPAYLGYLLDPIGQMRRFPMHPMSDLMSVFWPGHLFYVVFPPLLANYLYKICLVSFLLYLTGATAARLFGSGYGMAAAILVGTNAFFFQIQGSDYVEGMAMFYVAAVLYLVVRAAADPRRRWAALLGVGMVCLVSAAFLTLSYLPGLGALYLLLKRRSRRLLLGWDLAWIAAGAGSCIAVFCLLHRLFAGTWIYIVGAILKARFFLAMDRTPSPPSQWFPDATWLLPGIIVVVFFLTNLGGINPKLPGRSNRGRLRLTVPEGLAVALVLSLFALSYLQFVRHQGTVSDRYYYNQLIPLVSVALVGAMYREFGSAFGSRSTTLLACAAAAVWFENTEHAVSTTTLLWSCLIGLVLALFVRNAPRLIKAVDSTGCWLVVVALGASFVPTWSARGPFQPQRDAYSDSAGRMREVRSLRRESFTMIVNWARFVRRFDSTGRAWLWYDRGERMGGRFEYLSFVSHLFQARLINERFPRVVVPDNDWHGPAHERVAPGMEVLVPTENSTPKLELLARNLADQGMRFELVARRPFVSGRIRFDVFRLRILAAS